MTYIGRPIRIPQAVRTPPPYLELPLGLAVLTSLKWQAIGLVGLVCHVVLVREIGPAWAVPGAAALAWLATQAPLAAFIVFLQVLMYQNVLISLFSPGMSHSSYIVLSGASFMAEVVVAGIFALQILRSADWRSRRLCLLVGAAIGVVTVYLGLGAVTAGPTSAAISFRQVTDILFPVFIGLRIGQFCGYRTAAICFLVSGALGLLLATLELADPVWYLSLVNAASFGNLKIEGLVTDQYFYDVHTVIDSQTSAFFNSPLFSIAQDSFRFGGPNMHSISYAYVLGVAELVLLSLGSYALVLLLLVFSFIAGVKGPMVLFGGALALYLFWRVTGNRRLLLVAGLGFAAFYAIYGIETGIEIGDPHALGFMGGVNGFLANPLGHGLGSGGNFAEAVDLKFWEKAQSAGAASVGLESSVGVLLYQMGIGCIAVFAALFALARAASFGRSPKGGAAPTDVLFLGLGVGLVNGVFQEEAYSPYAVGLLVLFCAILVANGRRRRVIQVPRY